MPVNGIFYMNSDYMSFINSYMHNTDPGCSHLPNIDNIDGLMNCFQLVYWLFWEMCLISGPTGAPTQEETRNGTRASKSIEHDFNTIPSMNDMLCAILEALPLHLINWVRHLAGY